VLAIKKKKLRLAYSLEKGEREKAQKHGGKPLKQGKEENFSPDRRELPCHYAVRGK